MPPALIFTCRKNKRTTGTSKQFGDRGVVKSRNSIILQRKTSRKTTTAFQKASKIVVKKKKKTFCTSSKRVKKTRKKKLPWEIEVESAITVLRRTPISAEKLEKMKEFARKEGSRPESTMFEFDTGQCVMVLWDLNTDGKKPLWVETRVSAVRKAYKNNCLVSPRPMEHGKFKPGEIIIVQRPEEKWMDLRANGYAAFRDWQVIPIIFFGKKHSATLECLSSQGYPVEQHLVKKNGKMQTVKTRPRHRFSAGGYEKPAKKMVNLKK